MFNSCFVFGFGVEKRCRSSMTCSKRVEELKSGTSLHSGIDVQFSESVIVPGKFDALHLGHRELLQHASALGDTVLVMTFPGMAEVLGWQPRKPTCSSRQRGEILNAWSEELSTNIYAVQIPFSEIRSLEPKEFIEFVVNDFNTSAIVCGNDWRFGYKAAGDVNMLKTICSGKSLVADVVGAMSLDDEPISSSRVRRALDDGDMELVQRLLGRPHQLCGRFDRSKKVVSDLENSSPRTGLYRASISSCSDDCPLIVRIDRNEEATACIEIVGGDLPEDVGETVDVNIHQLLEAK
uniref:FAD synthase n=1 Tax=Rhodosorus marinus TaxID=101924 RepID=A0A7S0G6X8_9RHOD|mmetsp:Transcript_4287/g.6076  ORF Transcript_4287/g.6076 Transcript_4287/m.6076 type:complete len:294 (+) Transcript_4287:149-1030(+)